MDERNGFNLRRLKKDKRSQHQDHLSFSTDKYLEGSPESSLHKMNKAVCMGVLEGGGIVFTVPSDTICCTHMGMTLCISLLRDVIPCLGDVSQSLQDVIVSR